MSTEAPETHEPAGASVAQADAAPPRRRRDRVIPTATYRLQLRPGFGFAEAAAVAPYLARLGVSHVYSSPYLQPTPGSMHGYDVVDPRRVNRELGGSRGHGRFCRVLGDLGLGQVLDIVPNHMAITGPENPWWWDVLENGPASRYARTFDVDWDPPEAYLRNLVLLPILGDHYGRVLEAGELRLERRGPDFRIRYHEHALPVAPRSLDTILAAAAVRARSDELAFLADGYEQLPPSVATEPASVIRRHRDKGVLRKLLARLLEERPRVGEAIDFVVAEVNADPDVLDALLARQNYRLAHWRAAGRDLGYRRFFDVTSLIGLRTEDELVFRDTHGLVLRWLAAGVIDGLRVDHPDGLRDPSTYVRRLRSATRRGWIVVEKILEDDEPLRDSWPVDGTTGYDFLKIVTGVLVDPAGEGPLTAGLAELTGEARPFAAISREARGAAVRDTLGSDLNRLTARFLEICEGHRRHRDHTRHAIHEALAEVAASMPVYRTYIRADAGWITPSDEAIVDLAIATAAEARPDLDPGLLAFLGDVLRLRVRGSAEADFVMRFQQLTGAVMAKGVEDTAFYRYHRLVALNEVGGDPARFSTSVEAFHAANLERLARWPDSMLTTSTHDTKRSEDVRARQAAISELPERWLTAAADWLDRIDPLWGDVEPDRAIGYLALQTLVGAWPIDADRLSAYLLKAAREAKVRTAWTATDAAYEAALDRLARALAEGPRLLDGFEALLRPIVAAGRIDSLAQALLKLTAPGVPDVYQGTELWDLSLVDPDNRRPVDFARRAELLGELEAGMAVPDILARADEGLPKLWLVHRALRLRRARPSSFDGRGAYRPLVARGTRSDHVVAYARGEDVVAIVPRLPLGLTGGRPRSDLRIPAARWRDTTLGLPEGRWRDQLTGREHVGGERGLGELLEAFPVALLLRDGEAP